MGLMLVSVLLTMTAAGGVPEIPGEELFLVPWGNGGSMLSRDDGDESVPQGPMSFAPGRDGEIWVLDALAARIVRFGPDGAMEREVPLPARTFEDLEVRGDRMFVLDRVVRRSVLVLEADRQAGEVPIEGPGIPEGGGVTAMFAEDDGVWLEYEHRDLVRVLDADGRPGDRAVRTGRRIPGSDDRLLAELDGSRRPVARVMRIGPDGTSVRVSRTVPLAGRSPRIAWIEAGPEGDVAAVFHLLYPSEDGLRNLGEENIGRWFGADLRLLATFRSPWCIRAWQQQRELRIAPDGALIGMAFIDEGVLFLRWRRP